MNMMLLDYMATRSPAGFKSVPQYFADADSVTYFLSDDLYYAERIDEMATIFRSEETGEMVGCKIKSVSHLVKKLGSFHVGIVEGSKMTLGLLFLTAETMVELSKRNLYAQLAEKIGDVPLDLPELCQAA